MSLLFQLFPSPSQVKLSRVGTRGGKGRVGTTYNNNNNNNNNDSRVCALSYLATAAAAMSLSLIFCLSHFYKKQSHTNRQRQHSVHLSSHLSRFVPTSRAHTHKHTVTQNMFPNDETAAQQVATRVSGCTFSSSSTTTKL